MAINWNNVGGSIWDSVRPKNTTTTLAPVAPVTTGANGGGGGGGINWQDLINGDPLYGQMKTEFGAESAADVASRNAAINRDFIRGGFDLSSLNGLDPSLKSVINPSSVTAAQGNQFSVAARIKQALTDQHMSDRVQLRQRGAVRSGEQGYLDQRAQTGADTQRYDALNGLLDAILGYNTQYVGAERARQQDLYAAMMAALARQLQNHGDDTGGGANTPPPAAGGIPPSLYQFDIPGGGVGVASKNTGGNFVPWKDPNDPMYKKPIKPGQPGFRPY